MAELHLFLSQEIISVLEGIRPEDLEEPFSDNQVDPACRWHPYISLAYLTYFRMISFTVTYVGNVWKRSSRM